MLAHGDYSFSGFHLSRTMHGRRLHVYHGPIFTNDSQPAASAILHCMVLYIHQLVYEGHEGHANRTPPKAPAGFPFSYQDVAILVLMCGTVPNLGRVSSDYAVHLQHCKAQVAASHLAKWDKVKDRLTILQDRKAEWQTFCQETPFKLDD
jgi:hypothetical protein